MGTPRTPALRALRPTLRGVLVGILAGRILPFRVAKRLAPGFRGGSSVPGWPGGEPSSRSSRVEISDPEISDREISGAAPEPERSRTAANRHSDPRSDSERRESASSARPTARVPTTGSSGGFDPRTDPLAPRPAGSRGSVIPARSRPSHSQWGARVARAIGRARRRRGCYGERRGAASASRLGAVRRRGRRGGRRTRGSCRVPSPLRHRERSGRRRSRPRRILARRACRGRRGWRGRAAKARSPGSRFSSSPTSARSSWCTSSSRW